MPEVLSGLASVKRACVLGARLEIVESDLPHLQDERVRAPRLVVQVQGNAVVILGAMRNGEFDPEVRGWLYWPKASELVFHGDDTFTIEGLARYRVLPREAVASDA